MGRSILRCACVCALGVVGLVGCQEVVVTAPLTFSIGDWDPAAGTGEVLDGVRVCELGTGNCEVTDANGRTTLDLPADQETSYTLDREGYASYLESTVVPAGGSMATRFMATGQYIADMHKLVNSPYPMEGTGAIHVGLSPDLAGVTFTLLNGAGKAYYLDEERNFRLDLTGTTSTGGGGFTEVSPGEYQIEIGGTAVNCQPSGVGWAGDSTNTVRVLVREGYRSRAALLCF